MKWVFVYNPLSPKGTAWLRSVHVYNTEEEAVDALEKFLTAVHGDTWENHGYRTTTDQWYFKTSFPPSPVLALVYSLDKFYEREKEWLGHV